MAYPTDPGSLTTQAEDEYLFGPDWLVAPVTTAGATERLVYLPPCGTGFAWENHYTAVRHACDAGGVEVTEATPLETFPLYRRVPT